MPKQPKGFGSAKRKAESVAKDKSQVSSLLKKAMSKADNNKAPLKKIWDDLMTLFRLISAWVSGKYKDVPWQTIVLAMAAIVYFVNPFDLIPDFIPVVGYLDDATVVAFVIASIKSDIGKFHSWEQTQS